MYFYSSPSYYTFIRVHRITSELQKTVLCKETSVQKRTGRSTLLYNLARISTLQVLAGKLRQCPPPWKEEVLQYLIINSSPPASVSWDVVLVVMAEINVQETLCMLRRTQGRNIMRPKGLT